MTRLPSEGTQELRIEPEPGDGETRLRVSGEVDLAAAPALDAAVDRALDEGAQALRLDLSGVCFLDSSGLGALLGAGRRAQERGARMAVTSPHGSEARLVIELSGTAGYLGLVDET